MLPSTVLWVILLLPLFSLAFISLVLRPFFNNYPKLSGYTIISCLAVALGLSIWVMTSSDQFPIESTIEWAVVGDFRISLGFVADNLTAIMLIVVTGISLMVQIYSQGYMHGDSGYHRYFAFMSLFTASMLGLVLASNLLLVYVFWEGVGLGSYLLIGFWFHKPSAAAAAKKAFIVTRLGDFGFLIAILILYFTTGTFNIAEINGLAMAGFLGGTTLTLVALGIFSGAVGKSAQFPLHTWLPDAHTEAPTAGSVILAGVLLKMGAYGFLRFNLTLFPEAAVDLALIIGIIGVIGIIYGAAVAIVQPDVKRLVAYSSVSHMGFIMLGLFALNEPGLRGAILQMLNHGVSTGALFLLVGIVYERRHNRMIAEYGGLAKVMPIYATFFLVITMSSIGLPTLNGFIGEFLILIGAYNHSWVWALFAASGIVLGAAYMLWLYQRVFFGELTNEKNKDLKDLNLREQWTLIPLVIIAFWIGLYPKPFFDRMAPTVDRVLERVAVAMPEAETAAGRVAEIAAVPGEETAGEHGE